MADTRPPGRLARIPLLAPTGPFGFALVAALTALAVLVRLGEQGSRIGELLCPALDAKWLAAAALAIFLMTPKARASIPGASLAVHLAVLAVWGLSLRFWLESTAGSDPTLASVSRSSNERGDVERVVSLDLGTAAKHLPVRRLSGRNRDITLKISGFLRVVESGVHRFEVRTDGRADLTLDGEPLGPEKAGSTTVSLLPGLHPVEIEYERGSGPAFLRVDWNRPSFFELLPFHGYFSSSPTRLDPPTIRRMETLAVLSLLSSALWWTFCGLLVVRVGEGRAKLYQALSGAGRIDAGVAWVRNHSFLRPCLTAAIGSVLVLAVVLLSLLPRDRDHVFYRETSSEFMMQTVSVADLKQQPFRSLWFLHIQPPLLDAIRMVAALISSASEDEELVREVDGVIRLLWVLGHAALATLICLWLCRTTSPKFAVTASILFAAHPAGVFYATLLDSTLLSSLWFTWCCYELWRFYEGRGSVVRLVVATLALFFTRSIFQWPFLLLMAGALLLLRARRREVTIFAAAVGVAAGLYVGKQFALFGMTYTSSFAGYNGLRSMSGRSHVGHQGYEEADPSAAAALGGTGPVTGGEGQRGIQLQSASLPPDLFRTDGPLQEDPRATCSGHAECVSREPPAVSGAFEQILGERGRGWASVAHSLRSTFFGNALGVLRGVGVGGLGLRHPRTAPGTGRRSRSSRRLRDPGQYSLRER